MSAQHTRGPWRAEKQDSGRWSIESPIFHVAVLDGGLAGNQELANARLIAAAPELLEALQAFNVREEDIVAGQAGALILRVQLETIQKAAAAIAKATGSAA